MEKKDEDWGVETCNKEKASACPEQVDDEVVLLSVLDASGDEEDSYASKKAMVDRDMTTVDDRN